MILEDNAQGRVGVNAHSFRFSDLRALGRLLKRSVSVFV